ncbi:DNA-binding transcriptional MocR family regulator [Arthrobacter sp. V4I6]|uniref:MocR-like transcription factor YczR n=1 Tax=unclassified Arthrobacter TaxID=235627 RepID=UPI002785A2B1|nr:MULTISPECIES: PLP-dependent aminotransferase family protein [unclassified Arthrobacter]MDQ0822819.1 DNA-binding transcriptional MocR family regulator [Arthrobacter sp. V1I7]MDQ0852448.1 DNA-binding transcriptional MocR family regulator [Arthrobacter sp. V4I6]
MSGSLNPASLARLLGQWHLGASPAYRELADVVRLLVLDGRVPLDVALPSERSLAGTLGVSRTTVTAAYALLREQGFLSSGQGSRGRTCIPRRGPEGAVPDNRSEFSRAPGLAVPDGLLDLAYASLPASGEVVHRAFAAALTELPALLPGFGYDALGVAPLREAIAARYSAAGVPTTAHQILVTSGAQHALNVVLRTLGSRSAKVLVEHPSYPNALDAIRAAGCRIVPAPLPPSSSIGEPGWDMDALETALRQQRPAMAYVVPDFHNPTGRLMPDSQRRRLARAAAASGTVLVVDETLRELNLDGAPSTPLAAFSPAVVSIGSLSKSHWAGLRTGWIRAGEPLIQRFAAARTTMDLGGPVVEQLAAAHLVNALTEPLPARLASLRHNRDTVLELISGHLPTWQTERPDGGLSVWCRLPAPLSTALTVIAPEFGIRLAAGPRFGIGGAFEHYLRVPFTLPPEQLETAVLSLRSAQDRLEASPQLRRELNSPPAVAIA